jgi:hypothetical protein
MRVSSWGRTCGQSVRQAARRVALDAQGPAAAGAGPADRFVRVGVLMMIVNVTWRTAAPGS